MATTTNSKKKKLKSVDWTKQFDRVSKYINRKHGYTVEIIDGAAYEYAARIDLEKCHIEIKQNQKKELMLYLLLHEIGHVLFQNKTREYSNLVLEPLAILSKSSLSSRTIVLYEEMEAWNEGFFLAKKLSLPIDRKTFETYKTRCLKTYMNWVLNVDNIIKVIVEKHYLETLKLQQKQIIPSSTNTNNSSNIHYEILNNDETDQQSHEFNQTQQTTTIIEQQQ